METTDMSLSILRTRRRNKLDWYEREIDKRGKSFAQIFKELHSDSEKPYLATHDSFEEYCQDRWHMTASRARQIMNAGDGRTMLAAMTVDDPELSKTAARLNDSQAIEFKKVPPEKAAAVLRDAVSQPGKMTANKIKQAKARVIEPALPRKYPAQTTSVEPTPSPEVLPPTSNVCPNCHGTGRIE